MRRLSSCLLATSFAFVPAAFAEQSAPRYDVADLRAAEREAPAVIRSKARLELRSTLAVPIRKAPFTDGARFRKGALLVSFDCRTLAAERSAARAAAAAEALEVSAKTRLVKHGAAGKGELRRARALHKRAKAQSSAIGARMKACELRAPFAGRVVRLSSRAGEVPASGAPVVTIIDDSRIDLEIVAPSRWLAWAKPGLTFSFDVEETGATLPGRLVAIGPEVDPVSRTVRLFGSIDPKAQVLPGMSGRVRFEPAR